MRSRRRTRSLSLATAAIVAVAARAQAQHAAVRPPVPGAPRGVTAFVDVAVVPMDTERVLPHQTVLIRGGRIAALGPVSTLAVPKSAVQIDGQGKYLMPGLGICHEHLGLITFSPVTTDYVRRARLALFRHLAMGVTFMRNMDYVDRGGHVVGRDRWGDPLPSVFTLTGPELKRLRGEAAAGMGWSPRLVVAGQWAPKQYLGYQWNIWPDSAKVWPQPRLDSIAAYVAAYKAAGYDFLKIHEERLQIADSVFAAARRVGLQVGGHVVDSVGGDTHGHSDQAHALAGGQRVADHSGGFPEPTADTAAWRSAVAAVAGARRRAGMWTCGAEGAAKALVDSGAGLLYWDFNSTSFGGMERNGLTPYQALATATKNFGRYLLTMDPHGDETGTIAVGQRADLLLVDDNPLADARAVDFIPTDLARKPPAIVMIGGRWLARAELERRKAVLDQFDRLLGANEQVLAGIADTTASPPLQRMLRKLKTAHQQQAYALMERFVLTSTSPAGAADSLRMPERLTELFARQLGEVRAALPAARRDRFDEQAHTWLADRATEGHRVTIPGVKP